MKKDISDSVFAQYLDADETIVWTGRPPQGLMLRGNNYVDIVSILLVWGFLTVVCVVVDFRAWVWALVGVTFVGAWLCLFVRHILPDAFLRSKTYYAVTDNRVLIINWMFGSNLHSLDFLTMDSMTLRQKSHGRGTITFDNDSHFKAFKSKGEMWGRTGRYTVPKFDSIENVKQVFDTICNAKRTHNRNVLRKISRFHNAPPEGIFFEDVQNHHHSPG